MSIPDEMPATNAAPASPLSDVLQSSDGTLKLLVENVTDYAIYMLDPTGRIVSWNLGAERLKGYRQEEVIGKNFSMFFLPEGIEANEPEMELGAAARDGRFEVETWRRRKGGEKFWALVCLTAIRNSAGDLVGFAKVTRDMTTQKTFQEAQVKLALELEERVRERTWQLEASVEELRTKNEEIESLVAMVSHDLEEKEVLLREVYHRVKNNLQVVQSLLKMGARTLQSPEARQSIENAVQRVHVMAMVHEHLYQMPDLSGLTLSTYLRDVVEGSVASNSEQPNQIELQFDVEAVPVPLDFAVPFGLLANELISNCLKHGFVQGRGGRISVSAQTIPGAVRFVVRDNGVGLPQDFDARRCSSMGIKLAESLAHQLGGSLEFTSDDGCRIEADLKRLCPPGEKSKSPSKTHLLRDSLFADRIRWAEGAEGMARAIADPSCFR
jgi:PAS domain S-box-containing protein